MRKSKIRPLVLATLVAIVTAHGLAAGARAPLDSPTARELAAWIPGTIDRELFNASDFGPTLEIITQRWERIGDAEQKVLDDDVFLGRLTWKPTLTINSIALYEPPRGGGRLSKAAAARKYVPPEMAALLFPDIHGLDADRYTFNFLGYESLDGIKCLVVGVQPGRGLGFRGKLWLEDSQLDLVRFSGGSPALDNAISTFLKHSGRFHVESWRSRGGNRQWVPSTAYVLEEVPVAEARTAPRIRMLARAWGYQESAAKEPQTYTDVVVERATVAELTVLPPTPIQVAREHRRIAEDNILEWLTVRGIIAPESPLDGAVCGVANRLLVAVPPSMDEPIRCRTLMVSRFDVIVVGRTLITSRGLIDATIDEGCLSRILAHFAAHLIANDSIEGTTAFADRLMRPDREVLETIRQRYSVADEEAADKMAVKLLNGSVYRDKLSNSILFMQTIAEHARQLTGLLPASFMAHLADPKQTMRFGIRIARVPVIDPENSDQLLARPLGSRVKVDSWSSNVELLPIPSDPIGPGETLLFAVTPLRPYIGIVRQVADTR